MRGRQVCTALPPSGAIPGANQCRAEASPRLGLEAAAGLTLGVARGAGGRT
jgi:hypothetical protein